MRILITGADQPLGARAAAALRQRHELRLTGRESAAPEGLDALPYTPADLREPQQVAPLVDGVEAVAHLALHAPLPTSNPEAEKWALDWATQGTYVLLEAAREAGISRVVMASRLDLMAAYPEDALVDETWKPRPEANAASLAPWLAELTLREYVRAAGMVGVCLRFGELGPGSTGTTPEDAVVAIERALTMDVTGSPHRWWLYHIASGDRYPTGAAAHPPLNFRPGGA